MYKKAKKTPKIKLGHSPLSQLTHQLSGAQNRKRHIARGEGGDTQITFPPSSQTCLNLSVCWIYLITASRISLLSLGFRFSLPYSSIFAMAWFSNWGTFLILHSSTGLTVASNSFLREVNKGQLKRKWSEVSILVPQQHASVGVSLKLWRCLWECRGLKPTRSWYIYFKCSGSCTLNVLFCSGRMILSSFCLNSDNVSIFQISGPRLFQIKTESG